MATTPAIFQWMGTLSDPMRLRALRVLDRQELSVADLCDVLQLPQSTVSRHLKLLGDDGWVSMRRDGTSRLYRLSATLPAAARKLWQLLREQLVESGVTAADDARLEQVRRDRQTRTRAFFASSAANWDKLRSELFGDRLELPLLAGLLDPAWTVGDLGCGTGALAQGLAPFVTQVVAVDDSGPMLSAARRRTEGLGNVDLRRGAMEELPLADGSLDAAILALVLHHLPEPARALGEVARVLKAGGRVVILDMQPHDRAEYRAQMGHRWQGFAPEQLEGWLEEAGLIDARVHPMAPVVGVRGPPLFAATARLPLGRRRPNRAARAPPSR